MILESGAENIQDDAGASWMPKSKKMLKININYSMAKEYNRNPFAN